jgi:hypothetical protein
MMKPMRLLVAAALFVMIGNGVAMAQTVMIRNAPPGETIEVFLNATKVASASVQPNGETTLPLNLRENNAGKTEIDANIFIDVCDKIRRIIVVERGQPAATQEPGCERRDIPGLYWVRRVNTLVVDVGGANPTMMLVKGSFDPNAKVRNWSERVPTGLLAFGGIGRGDYRDAVLISCGTATTCDGDKAGLIFSGGLTFWVSRFLGAEASYFKPSKTKVNGSGSTYAFNSSLDTNMLFVGGRAGVPAGPVRISGLIGMDYQDSVLKTTDTINGASQNTEVETKGWGMAWGAGMEIWVSTRIAISIDAGVASLKGDPTGGGEVRLDDRLRYISGGVRVRIGK